MYYILGMLIVDPLIVLNFALFGGIPIRHFCIGRSIVLIIEIVLCIMYARIIVIPPILLHYEKWLS